MNLDILQLDCVLIVDDLSRKELKVNLADLIIYNVKIYSSLREIPKDVLNTVKKVVLLDKYVNIIDAFSDMQLYKEIFKLEYYYLGLDNSWLATMSSLAKVFKMDISILDYDRLYSVLYNDRGKLTTYLQPLNRLSVNENLANKLLESTGDSKIRELCVDFLEMKNTMTMLMSENNKLKLNNQKLVDANKSIERENQKICSEYKNLLLNVREADKIAKQYENIYSQDIYEKINLNLYKNRPKILYLKQYDELLYLNSFLDCLYFMFKSQAMMSVKIIRLFDSATNNLITKIPEYYHVIDSNKQNYSEVLYNDYIAKVGSYKSILNILLNNKVKLDLLIIVDCKNYNDVILNGATLHLNLCRRYSNLKYFKLPKENTITNDGLVDLSWNYYEEYPKFPTEEELYLFLSSRPVMKKIYNLACNNFGIS